MSESPRGRSPGKPAKEESSVVFSLAELVRLERARVAEEAEAVLAKERAAAEDEARLAREAEDAAVRALEQKRQADARARMLEAQLDGARLTEIERSKLETAHRLQLERLDREAAHALEMARLYAATQEKTRGRPWIWATGSLVAVIAAGAMAFFALQAPKQHARESIERARVLVEKNDASSLARAESELAVARADEPSNPEITTLQAKIDDEKAELRRLEAAKEAAHQHDVDTTAALSKEVQDKLAALKQPKPETASSTDPKPAFKPKVPIAKTTKDGGCAIEVAGVPMCAKK